ncbi:MAG: ThiF family adenylyltransferase [Candidatus Rokubacteria bacterium]|nr:ThiF family adenylyltransferase [Candidatus Rokubacteria bacterium]
MGLDLGIHPPNPVPVATVILTRPGALSGALRVGGRVEPLHALKVTGAGMHRIWTAAGRPKGAPRPPDPAEHERWSRAIGALGLETWLRLRELHYAIVGVGRTGSLLATSLARLGAQSLTLIDPDRLEIHNVDAMDGVRVADVGRAKVDALRDSLAEVSASPERLTALAASVTSVRALVAAKAADVLIASVDTDAARLSCATIAALYAKPLLDIGTGVHGVGDGRRLGADVRLVVPGDRCLLCLGA